MIYTEIKSDLLFIKWEVIRLTESKDDTDGLICHKYLIIKYTQHRLTSFSLME